VERIEIDNDIERERKILSFLRKKISWVFYLILAAIIWINIKIRMLPLAINSITGKPGLWDISRNAYTLGPDLDPFLFFRYAKTIVEQGALPLIDSMRFFPLGHSTLLETKLLPYSMAYLHKFLSFFSDKITIEYSAVIFPVIISVFTTIAFFLLVRKIFEGKGKIFSNVTALMASLFLVTLPSLLTRTIAGIPEKESLGFALMFFAFYFFLSAWKSKKIPKALIFGVLAGLFTALMGLVWGGSIFVFITIAISGFMALILGKVTKKSLIVYSSWLFCSIMLWIPFTLRMSLENFLKSSSGGLAFMVWFFMFIYYLIFKTKLKDITK
jgi:asparagine N-glycosylation enzyme membrane subunit Stt3